MYKEFLFVIMACVLAMLAAMTVNGQPAWASHLDSFTAKIGDIELGKQGVHLGTLPIFANTVMAGVLKEDLEPRYTHEFDLTYRAPLLEMHFYDAEGGELDPSSALVYVYFNIGKPERDLWEDFGSEEIAIWHWDDKADSWEMCATFYVKSNFTIPYGRLACLNMGNGYYVLGHVGFDKELYSNHTEDGLSFAEYRRQYIVK
jgi:hypothetical protein